MAKKRNVRTKKKRRRGRGGTSTLPGARRAAEAAGGVGGMSAEAAADAALAALGGGGADAWERQQREIQQQADRVEAALVKHSAGLLAEAEAEYRAVLEDNPDHFDAIRLLAAARLGQEDPQGAIEMFERAMGLGPLDSGMRSNMAYALKKVGRFDESIEMLQEILDDNPNFTDALINLGAAQMDSGRDADAIETYEKLLEKQPDNAEAWFNKGRALGAIGEHKQGVGALERAVEIAPTESRYLARLGILHLSSGVPYAAARTFDRMLALDPDSALAYYLLGRANHEQGFLPEAIANFRKAVELNPDYVEALTNLGSMLRRTGEGAEARRCYARAVEAAPHHVPSRFNLANLDREYGDEEQAVAGYREVISMDPGYFGAHVNLTSCLNRLGRADEAVEAGRAATAIEGAPDPELAWGVLAGALELAGDFEGAEEAWERAYELKPNDRFLFCGALVTPVVLTSPDHREEVGEALLEGIEEQLNLGHRMTPVARIFDLPPADLAGQGRDDSEALRKLEELLRATDLELQFEAGHCHQPRPDPDGPLRLGIVFSNAAEADDDLMALGLARAIPRERAFVLAYCIGEPRSETARAALEAADESVTLPVDYLHGRNRISDDVLDAVIHVSPTRTPVGHCLGLIRLARCQVGVGSGGDGALSKLQDMGEVTPPVHVTRRPPAQAAPAEGAGPTYVCTRPLRDIGPEFDALAAAILASDESARLVIRSHGASFADAALRERLEEAGAAVDRIDLVQADDPAALSGLFAGAAAALEPPGHGWLPTTALALSAGVPVIALAGERAALPGVVVAADADAYVAAAQAGEAGDSSPLWDDPSAVSELVEKMRTAVEASS